MKCSLIIPAYNEAGRIGRVLDVVQASRLFAEIVVVDDGSSDGTRSEAERDGVRVIVHAQNRGKARAMETGLAETAHPVIAFVDADLLAFTPEHLQLMVEPVVSGAQRATLAVFRGGRRATSLAQRIAPMISGQRCLRRELLDDFAGWHTRFGIETAINDHLKRRGVVQHFVIWEGAGQVMKEEKRGFWAGVLARIRMFWEIFITWSRSKLRPGRG